MRARPQPPVHHAADIERRAASCGESLRGAMRPCRARTRAGRCAPIRPPPSTAAARRRALRRRRARPAGRLRGNPRRNRRRRTRCRARPAATRARRCAAIAARVEDRMLVGLAVQDRCRPGAAACGLSVTKKRPVGVERLQPVHPVGDADGAPPRRRVADVVPARPDAPRASRHQRWRRYAAPRGCGCSGRRRAARVPRRVGSASSASAWSACVAITTWSKRSAPCRRGS